ncbi:serine/threonine-protein kinase [Streptomyces mexicanus]|uniref:serine/threonine-protein kinase n=1 Tax=Streptomyces mexicanus TaxID=178566 RepID=UPI0031E9730E
MEALKAHDPAQIGAYTLLARLGAGGMGQVYLGRSPGGRLVALKVIREEITGHPTALVRFRREVETVRAVRSAYTANLIDASLDAAPYWLATEYVEGPTLSKAVADRGPLPAPTCRGLFAALAEGLAAVHAQGVTHRDLKPHNVILASQGPQLIDFGIARGLEQTALTEAGAVAGTPGFTAPEVLMRNEVGPAADVFALGATLAYAATGRPPFGVGEPATVSYRAVHEPIDVAGVDPALAAVIEACVAKDPAARPGLPEVITRCGVQAALIEDPFYRGLIGRAERVPGAPLAPVSGSAQPADLHHQPTVVPYQGFHGYTPTELAHVPKPRGKKPWLAAVAAGVVVGVGGAAAFLFLPGGGDKAAGGTDDVAGRRPGATSAVASTTSTARPTGGGSTVAVPRYVEPSGLSKDQWQSQYGGCNLAPDERAENLQYSVVPEDGGDSYTSGRLKVTVRLKYADPKPGESYFMSVAVKPPHPIDPKTGEALDNSAQGNMDLGFTSRPIDMYQVYAHPENNGTASFTYPDDFHDYLHGKVYQDAFPVAKAPGDWTVIVLHVTKPQQYATIACDGFHAE